MPSLCCIISLESLQQRRKPTKTVTVFRVLPENPGMEDFVTSDEMTARAKAEELGASLCSRVFELPAKWSIFEINDEELIYDNQDNPYT